MNLRSTWENADGAIRYPPPPDPTCTCGDPRASHHRTPAGRIAQCTVARSTGLAVAIACPCKAYTPRAEATRGARGTEPPNPHPGEGPPHAAP